MTTFEKIAATLKASDFDPLEVPPPAVSLTPASALLIKPTGINRIFEDHADRIGVCLLGRYGDVLNILPICRYVQQRHSPPLFFIADKFKDVLEGVSYVIPRPLKINYERINEAVQHAHSQCSLLITAQIWGDNWFVDHSWSNFNFASWQMAGFAQHFYDTQQFPLIIDRRNKAREAVLWRSFKHQHAIESKPLLLLHLNSGFSSAFEHGQNLTSIIVSAWSETFHVIDISHTRAERVFDLLALLDRANILITADSVLLHLAAATTLPVIALVNDCADASGNEWLGTLPRCRCILRLGYRQALPKIAEIHAAIQSLKL